MSLQEGPRFSAALSYFCLSKVRRPVTHLAQLGWTDFEHGRKPDMMGEPQSRQSEMDFFPADPVSGQDAQRVRE